MSGVITWRTVQGASPSEAGRGFESAQRGIAGAFDQFGELIRQREAGIKAGEDRVAEGNVQGFLDRLQKARSPDDVAALTASGELDTLRAGLRPADLARVRGAEEARTTSLRQGVVAENAFNDQILARTRAPLINEAKALAVSGDRPALQAFLAKHELGDESTFLTQMQATEQGNARWAQDQKKWAWEEGNQAHQVAQRPLEAARAKLAMSAAEEQIAASRDARDVAEENRASLKAAGRVAAENQFLKESGNVFSDGVFNPNDTQELNEMMVKNGIGDDNGERQAIIKRLSGMGELDAAYIDKDGKKASKKLPIPLSLVKQAILGSKDQLLSGGLGVFNGWNQGVANSVEENLRAAMLAVQPDKTKDGRGFTQNKAVFDYDRYMQNKLQAVETPAPASTKKR